MFGIFQRFEYMDWVEREKANRNPAVEQGLEECVGCGWCCARRTCVPTPDEIPGIAEFLGLTVEQLIAQYMVGDRMEGHEFLRFANTAQKDVLGEFLSSSRTFDKGDCILFHNSSGCAIHEVKPADAKGAECWVDTTDISAIESWPEGKMEEFGVRDNSYDWEEDWDEG